MVTSSTSKHLKTVALLFPGQGSQFGGMGMDLVQESAAARALLERADDRLGYSLSRIMAGEDPDALNRTVYTQPAVFVHSALILEFMRKRLAVSPIAAAGHSLGEYSALYAAGVLTFDEGLDLVAVRARAMNDAQPAGTCAMAAILGVTGEQALEIVDACRQGDVLEAANFNAPDQVVVSGRVDAVNRVIEAVKDRPRAKAVQLRVSSAFHTSLMQPAVENLARRLDQVSVGEFRFSVISNVTASLYPPVGDQVKQLLLDQLVHPVRWEESVRTLLSLGPETFVEVGPGNVLTGLLRRIDRKATGASTSDLEQIRTLEGAWA